MPTGAGWQHADAQPPAGDGIERERLIGLPQLDALPGSAEAIEIALRAGLPRARLLRSISPLGCLCCYVKLHPQAKLLCHLFERAAVITGEAVRAVFGAEGKMRSAPAVSINRLFATPG